MRLRRPFTRHAAGALSAALAIVVTTALAGPAGAASLPPPIIGWPTVTLDRRTLLPGTAEAVLSVSVATEIRNVPASAGYNAAVYLLVRDANTAALLKTVPYLVRLLPLGSSRLQATLRLDSTSGIPSGPLTVQTVLVAGANVAQLGFDQTMRIIASSSGRPPFAVVFTKEQGIMVLGEEPEKIRAYEAEVATGDPDLVVRGLSQLVMYHRVRHQYDLAEERVRLAMAEASSPEVAALAGLFHLWIADDRLLAGDRQGAQAVLQEALASTPPESVLLGEPFAARTLVELGRIRRQTQDYRGAATAFTTAITQYGSSASAIAARAERAETALRLGDLKGARADYYALVDSYNRCLRDPAAARCPDRETALEAERQIRIIDSNRGWYRRTPGEVVAVLQQAVAKRDIAQLDSIASPEDMKAGLPGGEWRRAPWTTTLRPLLASVLAQGRAITVRAPQTAQGPRMYVHIGGVGEQEGLPTDLWAIIEETPFGWQLGGFGGRLIRLPEAQGAVVTKLATTRAAATAATTSTSPVSIKAPWAPGEYMRVGGMYLDVEAYSAVWDVADIIAHLLDVIVSFDRCGPGVPGFYYNTGTHDDDDAYAIDITDGYGPIACIKVPFVGTVCLPDPFGSVWAIADLVEALVRIGTGGVATAAPTYRDPTYAAHAGLVVNAWFSAHDGDTDYTNRIDTAIWPGSAPLSIPGYVLGTINPALLTSTSLESGLTATDAPYWIKYVHLSEYSTHPSVGMWLQQGELVGEMDDTGNSFISHLHFAVKARPADPLLAADQHQWQSEKMILEGRFMDDDDNGACIRSTNTVVVADTDADGIPDPDDNCTLVPNPDQLDSDFDGVGEVCEIDWDNDHVLNDYDSCPYSFGLAVEVCDAPGVCHLEQADSDGDGIGDPCDPDIDGDGVPNSSDRCPGVDDSIDFDGDSIPDACDPDQDGDFWDDECEYWKTCGCMPDLLPRDPTQAGDHDGDGIDSLYDDCPCSAEPIVCIKDDPTLGYDMIDLYMRIVGLGINERVDAPIAVGP